MPGEPLAAMGAKVGIDLIGELEAGAPCRSSIARNYAQVPQVRDRVNLRQHGELTFDKPTECRAGRAAQGAATGVKTLSAIVFVVT